MSSVYLAKSVGYPLMKCLAELTAVQPIDPIEWIAHWLYRHTDNEQFFFEKVIYLQDVTRMKLELDRENELRYWKLRVMDHDIKALKNTTREHRALFEKKFKAQLMEEYDHQIALAKYYRAPNVKGKNRNVTIRTDSPIRPPKQGKKVQKKWSMTDTKMVDYLATRGSLMRWAKLTTSDSHSGKGGKRIHRKRPQKFSDESAIGYMQNLEKHLNITEGTLPVVRERQSVSENIFLMTHPSFSSYSTDIVSRRESDMQETVRVQMEETMVHIRTSFDRFEIPIPAFVDVEYLISHPSELAEIQTILTSLGSWAHWSLDRAGSLVCDHASIGYMTSRRPFVPPETPEWWQNQGFLEQTLYDHEIYSTDFTTPDNEWWNLISPLTYADFKQSVTKPVHRTSKDMSSSEKQKTPTTHTGSVKQGALSHKQPVKPNTSGKP